MKSKLIVLVLILAAILPYVAGLNFPFVYDDHGSIAENPFLKRPDALAKTLTLRTLFDPHVLDGQRPVVIVSYLLDQAGWKLNPLGYHITNVLLHAGSVLLLFSLLCKLSATPFLRVSAPLLFALHPALTEAVHVPAFREDLLAAFFLVLFLRVAISSRPFWSLPALALALGSKETAVVAPALLGWIILCFPSGASSSSKKSIGLVIASAALVFAFLVLSYSARPLQAASGPWNGLALRFPQNLWTSPWLFARWLQILIAPHPLCADYIVSPVRSFLDTRCLAGLAVVFATVAGAIFTRRRAPFIAAGLGWLIINYAPVSNLVPLFNPLADRYLYLPAIGFVIAIACALEKLPSRAMVLGVVIACCLGMTTARLQIWRSDETLWAATARTEPRSARAQSWLGILAADRGDLTEARVRYDTANLLNPQDVTAIINLAVLDGKAGDVKSAAEKLRAAVNIRPDKIDAWWNLALALHLAGNDKEAEWALQHAAQLDPSDPRAIAFRKTGTKKTP